MSRRSILAVIGLAVTSSTLAAQQGTITRVEPPKPALRFVEVWHPPSMTSAETRVIGSVIDIGQLPVAGVMVQLRNLISGRVVHAMKTSDEGQYVFAVADPGTYVVEAVAGGGQVIGLSNAGLVSRYQTLQTVVQLPGRWDSAAATVIVSQTSRRFVGASAATTMTAGTLSIAAQQNISLVDPGEPVSP